MSDLDPNQREEARLIAREEIASLCGLILRRTQDMQMFDAAVAFGEALRDFTTDEEPGKSVTVGAPAAGVKTE